MSRDAIEGLAPAPPSTTIPVTLSAIAEPTEQNTSSTANVMNPVVDATAHAKQVETAAQRHQLDSTPPAKPPATRDSDPAAVSAANKAEAQSAERLSTAASMQKSENEEKTEK